jgi:hypothetical protein
MTEPTGDVRALIEQIAKWIVDAPDQVFVDHLDDDVIELEVAEGDVGKVIGRQGRNVRALRTLLSAGSDRLADLVRNCFERARLLAVPLPGNKNAGFSS